MRKQYDFETAGDVVAYFLPDGGPDRFQEFQRLCADLCGAMGFQVKARAKANGSGYKLELKFGSEVGIIDCLCYVPTNLVPRSHMQRLIKENPDVEPKHMIIITTSDFMPGARVFSQGTGIRAVSGEQLIGLLKKHDFILEKHVEVVEPEPEEPKDLRGKEEEPEKAPEPEKPKVVPKSSLAARASVQRHKPKSQRFDARAFMQSGRNVKPYT